MRTQNQTPLGHLLMAMGWSFLVTCLIFLRGRRLSSILGQRGVQAMEKFMGLLLNLVAVNMILTGVKEYLAWPVFNASKSLILGMADFWLWRV